MLFLALIISFFLAIQAYLNEEWNVIASSLAVVTAIIAAFSSMKIIWKQEDDLEPNLYVYFDLQSRSGVIQLVVKNVGGSTAYDLKLKWSKPLLDHKQKEVSLPYTPTLSQGESIRFLIDSSRKRLNESKESNDLIYEGNVGYKKSKKSNRIIRQYFEIGLHQFEEKPMRVTDEKEFYLKNSYLNKSILKLNEHLKDIAEILSSTK